VSRTGDAIVMRGESQGDRAPVVIPTGCFDLAHVTRTARVFDATMLKLENR